MKLLFTQDGFVDGVLTFKKGHVYDIPADKGSADRWLRRGAILAPEVKPPEAPVMAPVEPPKEVVETSITEENTKSEVKVSSTKTATKQTSHRGRNKDATTDL